MKSRHSQRILRALLQDSRGSDRKIAKIADVSQPTITRQRNYLESIGLIRFATIPKYSELDYTIMAISQVPMFDANGEATTINSLKNDDAVIAVFMSLQGLIVLSLHKSFAELLKFKDTYLAAPDFVIDIQTGIVKDFDFSKLAQ